MKKTFLFTVIASVFAILSTSYADDQSSGCGLGWMVIKKNSLVSSSLRQSTNVLASNTIAMTSGTSGCAKHDIVLKEKSALYFAESNYQKLQGEMAEGRGEYLTAFAKVLGCNQQDPGALFQSHYEKIWTSDRMGPSELVLNTKEICRL